MRISDCLAAKQTFSFEIFPPKGDLPIDQALEVAGALDRRAVDGLRSHPDNFRFHQDSRSFSSAPPSSGPDEAVSAPVSASSSGVFPSAAVPPGAVSPLLQKKRYDSYYMM